MQKKGMDQICLSYNMRRATRLVTRIYDEALSSTGLRNTQFTVLAVTEAHQPVSVATLAQALGMDRTTLTRNLKPLERDGLIKIKEGKDRRIKEITTTAKGRKLILKARPQWEEAQIKVEQVIGQKRTESLVRELDSVVEALREA